MTLRARFSAEAAAELDHAMSWYEEQHAGLGDTFLTAVEEAVALLADWPQSGVRVDNLGDNTEVRRAPILRFSYHLA